MEKTAVTSICWIPRGKCKANPKAEEADDDELREAAEGLEGVGSSSSGAVIRASSVAAAVTGASGGDASLEGLEEFGLDKYDDDVDNDGGMQFFSVLAADSELLRDPDPHMKGGADSDSDSEDYYEIRPQDQVFAAASCEEESCVLEVYVLDGDEATMYVHHDIMLTAYPLCVEWLSRSATAGTGEGNFCAVGLIDHTVQIWDLDRLDPVNPCQSLGEVAQAKTTKNKKKKKKARDGPKAHEGPVLALHGSPFNRNVIVSGSGDQTVKVWDVAENACVHSYTHHTDKVQCARWHPTEQAVLLSASFDRRLALMDVRQPGQVAKLELPAEAEAALWCQHRPFECIASCDNGGVACYDVRKVAAKAPEGEQLLWSLQAHDVACTGVTDMPTRDLMVTCSLDGTSKIWNLSGGKPKMVFAKDMQAGPLFTCQSDAESPATVCFGGRCPVIWDLSSEDLLKDVFKFGGSNMGE